MNIKTALLLTVITLFTYNTITLAHCGSCEVGNHKATKKTAEPSSKKVASLGLKDATHKIQVSGMTCTTCSAKVSARLEKHKHFDIIDIDYKTGVVYIKSTKKRLPKRRLRKELAKSGYKLEKISKIKQKKS